MKVPEQAKRRKVCKRCRYVYEGDDIENAFRSWTKNSANNYSQKLRATCELCYQDERTSQSRENRFRVKVRRARQSHARKLGLATKELEEKHGWNLDVMEHDARYAYHNGCPECHRLYSSMENGLGDLTLDIWDRRIEPGYGSNTRWMGKTCNLAKGIMTPEAWNIRKRLWRERSRFLEKQEKTPIPTQLSFMPRESVTVE